MSSHSQTRIDDHHEVLEAVHGDVHVTRAVPPQYGIFGLQLCIHGFTNRFCNVLDLVDDEAIILGLGAPLGAQFVVRAAVELNAPWGAVVAENPRLDSVPLTGVCSAYWSSFQLA